MTDVEMMVFELGSKGYTCSQILLIAALRMQGEENESLVRAANALSQGIANTGNICGALTGGLSILSLYSAKGNDFEISDSNEAIMWEELTDWFNSEICAGKTNNCDDLLNIDSVSDNRLSANQAFCGEIVGKVWEKCLTILIAYGIDPTSERV